MLDATGWPRGGRELHGHDLGGSSASVTFTGSLLREPVAFLPTMTCAPGSHRGCNPDDGRRERRPVDRDGYVLRVRAFDGDDELGHPQWSAASSSCADCFAWRKGFGASAASSSPRDLEVRLPCAAVHLPCFWPWARATSKRWVGACMTDSARVARSTASANRPSLSALTAAVAASRAVARCSSDAPEGKRAPQKRASARAHTPDAAPTSLATPILLSGLAGGSQRRSMLLEAGQVIDGKYRLTRLIGTGGMGAVYEGENVLIRRRVAIKVLNADSAANVENIRRFEREAQAAEIGNEHIPRGARPRVLRERRSLHGHGVPGRRDPRGPHPEARPPHTRADRPRRLAVPRGADLGSRRGHHPPGPQARERLHFCDRRPAGPISSNSSISVSRSSRAPSRRARSA